jgi:hypothetical protein
MSVRDRIDRPDVFFRSRDGAEFALHSVMLQLRWPHYRKRPDAAIRALSSLGRGRVRDVLGYVYAGLPAHESVRDAFLCVGLPFPPSDPSAPYRDDMRGLLRSHARADFRIDSCGRTFLVHRFVLAIRSAYFAALFQSGLADAQSGVLADRAARSAEQMERFLEFVYSGGAEFPALDDIFAFLALAKRSELHEGFPGETEEFVMGKMFAAHYSTLGDAMSRARAGNYQRLVDLIEACDI